MEVYYINHKNQKIDLGHSPYQLQIGDLIAKSPDKDNDTRAGRKKTKTENGYTPRVAVARDGYICIEPMTKGFLE